MMASEKRGPFVASNIILGEACAVLATLPPAFAAMAYLDPPFGTGKIWSGAAGSFSDRFSCDAEIVRAVRAVLPGLSGIIDVIPFGEHEKAYLYAMAKLFGAVRHALAPCGTMWLHCDDTMGAYLRVVAEFVFRHCCSLGSLVWRRTAGGHSTAARFGRVHDSIYVFGRSPGAKLRLSRLKSEFADGDPLGDFTVSGFIEDSLATAAVERVGYPTQKPESLLERLISSATVAGDLVLDPTCGSGTTAVAARRLGRSWMCIDQSPDAIETAQRRMAPAVPAQSDLFAA